MDNAPTELLNNKLSDAIRMHNEGVAGSKEAVRSAQAQFQSLRAQYPDNATVKAYYGSTLALMARDAIKPAEKLDLAKQGLALLDEAVASDPYESSFRMLRGKIAFRLPEQFFHRTETAIEDYAFLIDSELQDPGSLEQTMYATLVYELGVAYYRIQRIKEAQLCWNMMPKLTNDAKLLSLVNAKKNSLGRKESAPTDDKFEIRDLAGIIIGLAGASLLKSFSKRK